MSTPDSVPPSSASGANVTIYRAPWWRVLWHSIRCSASPARRGYPFPYLETVSGEGPEGSGKTSCCRCGFTYDKWERSRV